MKTRIIITIIVLLVGAAAVFGLLFFSNFQKEQPSAIVDSAGDTVAFVDESPLSVCFSHSKTFYETSIEVSITCADSNADIYFTTDGTTPTSDSKKYTGAISISSNSKVKATTLKVISIGETGESKVYTKSYVTGKNVFERFSEDTYIFILSTDPYNLYDYYYGVATEGYMRDDFLNSDEYNGGELDYTAPANWYISGRESERDMYVEVYDSTGNKLLEQAAGARVAGGASRAVEQKSWKLIARNEYSEGNGMFDYSFFNGAVDAYGQLITKYDRITLRNNANDREFASVRDELAMELSEMAGFPDIQEAAPAAVFLNGEYYGFSWLHENYCNGYLEQTYGGNKDNYRIVGDKEGEVEGDDEQSADDYMYAYNLAKKRLLTDDEKFEEFCSLVDIDNLMLYYAIQVYIGNRDWPGNNFKAWRYYASEGEETQSEYLDGKWRFLLFDLEFGMGLYGNGYNDRTLSEILTGQHMQGASEIMIGLLEREDMREMFANTVCDLISGSFSYENAVAVLQEKIDICDPECMYALKNGYTSSWANADNFADSRQQIRDFFQNRPRVIYRDLTTNFEYEQEMYNITVEGTEGAVLKLNSQTLTGAGTVGGDYYTACSVPVSASALTGYKFVCWNINGTEFTAEQLVITPDMARDGVVYIKAVFEKIPVENAPIYICKLYTSGNGDWFTLYNPNDNDVKTDGLFLSDDKDEFGKWQIPSSVIKANGSLTIVCKNNKESSALHKLVTDFNLKTGETLYLTDSDGNVISRAAVVDMSDEMMLQRDIDGVYRIVLLSE